MQTGIYQLDFARHWQAWGNKICNSNCNRQQTFFSVIVIDEILSK